MNNIITRKDARKFDIKLFIPEKIKARTITGMKENLAISNNFNIKSRNKMYIVKIQLEVYIGNANIKEYLTIIE
jgi:hypothetical protein